MCGIFGYLTDSYQRGDEDRLRRLGVLLSQRGLDCSGISLGAEVLKSPEKGDVFFKSKPVRDRLASYLKGQPSGQMRLVLGHTRLATHGSRMLDRGAQPVQVGSLVGVHNGILPDLASPGMTDQSDSQILMDQIFPHLGDLIRGETGFWSQIKNGSASVALWDQRWGSKTLLFSNTGSLYFAQVYSKKNPDSKSWVFGSEKFILSKVFGTNKSRSWTLGSIEQVKPWTQVVLSQIGAEISSVRIGTAGTNLSQVKLSVSKPIQMLRVNHLKRCSKCVLPETYPMITFDQAGVCNYCKKYSPQVLKGEEALLKILDRHRSKNGSPDCLVGLSGGRDSCYGLHLLKKKYGMNPIAYSYDWGLTSDRARTNQARLCGALGVEHLVRTSDLSKKRRAIQKNMNAWLKQPKLGMVPLFMAGDKDFYHYGRALRKETGVDLTVFSAGYQLEQREFFVGFCGVKQNLTNNQRLSSYKVSTKARLAMWYAAQYLKNPRYFNESFWDSLRSFQKSFLERDNFLYLYSYVPWIESEIDQTLQSIYGWECEPSFQNNPWRMGDGQTAMINFIFYQVAGFSEFDEFRSNQIREGLIGRSEALSLLEIDNEPKVGALQDVLGMIGIEPQKWMRQVSEIPKLKEGMWS